MNSTSSSGSRTAICVLTPQMVPLWDARWYRSRIRPRPAGENRDGGAPVPDVQAAVDAAAVADDRLDRGRPGVVVGRETRRPAPLEQHREVQLGRLDVLGLGDGGVQFDQVGEGLPIGFERYVVDG